MLAALRDERIDRPWDGPGAYWPDAPGIVAGRDRTAGGTWLGMNRSGVAAMVLNRSGSLGPAPGKRSRGELPLLALAQNGAGAACGAVRSLDAEAWRSFNMVIADRTGALFLRGLGDGHPESVTLSPGVHMVTAHDPDDPLSPRVARHLPRFRAADPPQPGNWESWRAILADRSGPAGTELNVPVRGDFGTVCASLIAIPADPRTPPEWLFAPGPPDRADFTPVMRPPA